MRVSLSNAASSQRRPPSPYCRVALYALRKFSTAGASFGFVLRVRGDPCRLRGSGAIAAPPFPGGQRLYHGSVCVHGPCLLSFCVRCKIIDILSELLGPRIGVLLQNKYLEQNSDSS